MKVGTDGVLLGAWASVRPTDRRILDIGTGTGLIALMLAQRTTEAAITGIDVASVAEARRNADASPWGGRLHFEELPVQRFEAAPFDLIVSNPPFFVESLTCPDAGRTLARHAVGLPFDELRDAVLRLLTADGRFALVLPVPEAERFLALCAGRLRPVRRTEVRTAPRRAPKRVLLELVRTDGGSAERDAADAATPRGTVPAPSDAAVERCTLTIGTGEHETYTEEYRTLTGDFYLKF